MSSLAAPPDPIRESYVPAVRPEDSSRNALPKLRAGPPNETHSPHPFNG